MGVYWSPTRWSGSTATLSSQKGGAMIRRGFAASALLAVFFCFALLAQSDLSTITGVVKDPSGSAVPGARITVRNEATGVERQTVSADSGTFSVTNLPSGFYTVTVEGQG